jgi:nucleoside-diphosphate-sugar epimerase
MRILVTGAAGYLGSTLTALLLKEGHEVRGLDSLLHGGRALMGFWAERNFSFVKGDVRDAAAVAAALEGVEAVVHLAAIVGDPACARAPGEARAVNLDASLALADAAEKAGARRFVFASTCSNYGKMADPDTLLDESSELKPVSLYAETKVAVERALLEERRAPGLCATALRLSTLYGVSARMRFDLTVNEFVMQLTTKGHLVVFGEQFWRPYLHVADAARAFALVLGRPAADVDRQVFNVGADDQNFRKSDLLDIMAPLAPAARIERVKKTEDPRDYRVSFAKIRSRLGFTPLHSVQSGAPEIARLLAQGVLTSPEGPEFTNTP